jgi:hypothetical protein
MQASEKRDLRTLPNIKRAYQKYSKYCKDVLFDKKRKVDNEDDKDIKKRKVETAASSSTKPAPSAPKPTFSKPTVPSTSSTKPAPSKPQAGRSSDMSFFGGSTTTKTKAPLPSFSKKPAASTAAAAAPVAPARSLLASTMKMLKKDKSPPPSKAPVASASNPVVPKPTGPKLNKKGHTVKWVDLTPAPTRDFLAVRLFTQEQHEFEPAPWQDGVSIRSIALEQLLILQGDVHGMSAHALDRQEGAAMHRHHGIEEDIDWYEPMREYYYHL